MTAPDRIPNPVPHPYDRASAPQPEPQTCPSHEIACVCIVTARVAEDVTPEQLRLFCLGLLTGGDTSLSGELFGELADMPKNVTTMAGPRSKMLPLAARAVQQNAANEARRVRA